MTAWGTALIRERDGKVLDVELSKNEDEARAEVSTYNEGPRPAQFRMAVVAIDPVTA